MRWSPQEPRSHRPPRAAVHPWWWSSERTRSSSSMTRCSASRATMPRCSSTSNASPDATTRSCRPSRSRPGESRATGSLTCGFPGTGCGFGPSRPANAMRTGRPASRPTRRGATPSGPCRRLRHPPRRELERGGRAASPRDGGAPRPGRGSSLPSAADQRRTPGELSFGRGRLSAYRRRGGGAGGTLAAPEGAPCRAGPAAPAGPIGNALSRIATRRPRPTVRGRRGGR